MIVFRVVHHLNVSLVNRDGMETIFAALQNWEHWLARRAEVGIEDYFRYKILFMK